MFALCLYSFSVSDVCFLLTDESSDSTSSGGVSAKVTALPPTLKRMLSEKDKDGPQSAGGSANKTTQDGGSQNMFLC